MTEEKRDIAAGFACDGLVQQGFAGAVVIVLEDTPQGLKYSMQSNMPPYIMLDVLRLIVADPSAKTTARPTQAMGMKN